MSGSARPYQPADTEGRRVRLPLLDELRGGGAPPEEAALRPQADLFRQLHEGVLRDLEALLNARRRRQPLPPEHTRLPCSPLGYGIPDITSGSFALEERRAALARDVAATIRRFEPRLTELSVVVREGNSDLDRTLRLRIEAVLRTELTREPVSFETVVEPTLHEVRVREG